MNTDIVRVTDVTYDYPGTRALDKVSFSLTRGSVTALVGPNGAGKSTLLRCMAALDEPLEGQIEVDGIDVMDNPRECHRRIGYLSDFFGLYNELTIRQSLTYAALSQGMDVHQTEQAVVGTVTQLQLTDKLESRCGDLSRGQRQRVAIGQALVHSPALLILDEPASGLDPEARHELAKIFTELRSHGMTLIVSSHILAELDEYSTHMLVINDGKIIESRSLRQHTTQVGIDYIRVEFTALNNDLLQAVQQAITELPDNSVVSSNNNHVVIAVPAEKTHKALLLRTLVLANFEVISFSDSKENLHEFYLRSLHDKRASQSAQGSQT